MEIDGVLENMTLEQKLKILTAKNDWQVQDYEGFELEDLYFHDGPHGLRVVYKSEGDYQIGMDATCFPTASAMASTWNKQLMYEVGQALAMSSFQFKTSVLLGPGLNIKRTPLCGRNFEYFSEDPYSSGKIGAAYVKGLQSKGVGACIKHFAANNQEYDRMFVSSEVDERTLREIYLKPFEMVIEEAKPWAIMCAYNRLNGVYCSENKYLLRKVLRKEWGYDGLVISDWGAVKSRSKSLIAGIDLEMPFHPGSYENLYQSYQANEISIEDINESVKKIYELAQKVKDAKRKMIEEAECIEEAERIEETETIEKAEPTEGTESIRTAERIREVCERCSDESITLLKNENQILPLKNPKSIAVLGAYAEHPMIQGGGSSKVSTQQIDIPLEELKKEFKDTIINYESGYILRYGLPTPSGYGRAIEIAESSEQAIIFVGEGELIEKEETDRVSIKLYPCMEDLILKIANVNKNTIVVVFAGDVIDMSTWFDQVKGVVYAWYSGETTGASLAKIISGRVNPSGKTQQTFPLCIEDISMYDTYPGDGYVAWYKEGLFVGYRYYDYYKKDVLIPFGYGLGYSTFGYRDLSIQVNYEKDKLKVHGSFTLSNEGSYDGKEIYQIYVRKMYRYVLGPVKELKYFDKIELEAGESKVVNFTLDESAFSYYGVNDGKFIFDDGKFDIMIGSSSRELKISGTIDVKSKN